jgi:hypothetical protein
MRRDPAKAIAVLDAMLEFFDGGKRWTRGMLRDHHHQHRCLIGALRHIRQQQRIRGAGTEHYLRDAMIARADDLDPLTDLWVLGVGMACDGDLMRYNDVSADYAGVRALIVEARAIAQAELDAAAERRRTSTVIQSAHVTARSAGDLVLPDRDHRG